MFDSALVSVVFETVHGSRAYGLAGPDSDTDVKGIFVPPAEALFGFESTPEQTEPEPEHVLYDIRKFFRLAAACNPTVIEILFTDPADHVRCSPVGARLLQKRTSFLSQRAGQSFGKYALAQLRRIKTHRRWLLEPPQAKPQRGAFGLSERAVIPAEQRGAATALMEQGRLDPAEVSPAFMDQLDRERRYRGALREWQQYQGWQRNRNPARAELERQHGYDTKHAMHLMRLLRMAGEILETGRVLVRRPDAEELKAIRQGAWPYDVLLERAETLAEQLPALTRRSPLPVRPDLSRLNTFCAELVADVLREPA